MTDRFRHTNQRVFRSQRGGKVVLLAMVFLLLMAILMAFVGNTGHAVNQKMELQQSADAVSFSSAIAMARGLNTVTACNHLTGEATAICVFHEAFGGPEMRLRLSVNTPQNSQFNSTIRAAAQSAPISLVPSIYVPIPLTNIDRRIVDFVTRRTSPPNDEQKAFATLYDARMTLKRELAMLLLVKSFANLAFLVPPPFGYVSAAAGYVAHIAATSQIVLIGKEWLLLDVLEQYAVVASPVQVTALEQQLVPLLTQFAGEVAGIDMTAAASSNPASSSPTGNRNKGLAILELDRMATDVAEQHQAETVVLPREQDRRLPLTAEPNPSMSGRQGEWPKGWGTDEAVALPSISRDLDRVKRNADRSQRKLQIRIENLERNVDRLQELKKEIEDKAENEELTDQQQADFDAEIESGSQLIQEYEQEILDLEKANEEIRSQRASLEALAIGNGRSQNLSLKHIPQKMSPDQERWTQWTRATVPNLDVLRAPVLGLMKAQLRKSRAAEHFEKWTNRYALVKAWQFRSGYQLRKTGKSSAAWESTGNPLALLVLDGTFSDDLPRKGREEWTGTTRAARQLVEDKFTLLAWSHREYAPIFAEVVFPETQNRPLGAFSHAMVYNANEQSAGAAKSDQQPTVGWDTLNWDPELDAVPEWGATGATPSVSWPWELLRGIPNRAKAKLNWQAKLIPLTQSKLEAASRSNDINRETMEFVIDHASLFRH
jgi:hypothetical protein